MKTRAIDASGLAEFLGLSTTIHAGDPTWVPPLQAVLARDLTGQGTFGRYAELQMFLCESAGRPVGRLAAIHNPRLPGVGQIGYLELVDDPAVLPSLLEQAIPWLTARGATTVWGPMDGGAHRNHRVMVRGFETAPHLLEPRNAPWVPRLLEAAGFERAHTWYGFDASSADARAVCERFRPLAQRAQRGFRRSALDPSDPRTLPRLHPILDDSWEGHIGYAAFDLDEFTETYAGLLAVGPHIGVVNEIDGPDVGLGLCYPDWVEEVRALQGDASGWAGWMANPTLPTQVVLHTVAMATQARNTGAAFMILDYAADVVLPRYDRVVVALVTENFPVFNRFLPPTREYALYQRSL